MDKQILQRILLWLFLVFSVHAANFPGFVSLAIVDTFTGKNENILLESGEITQDEQQCFTIKVNGIDADAENPSIAWVDVEIHYLSSKTDVPVCIQRGKLCTNQIYRFEKGRYVLGFDVLACMNEG